MTSDLDEAHLAVQHARDALRENRRSDARQWAERAAQLAPQMEDPWLILAAVASPKASLDYIQKALKINPQSRRAHRGMEWAMQRLREPVPELAETRQSLVSRLPTTRTPAAPEPAGEPAAGAAPGRKPRSPLAIILVGIGLLVCVAAGISAAMSPALASIIEQQVQPARPPSWAVASIAKPTYTPGAPLAFDMQPTEPTEATEAAEATPAPPLETSTISLDSPFIDPSTPTLVGQQPTTEEPPTAEPTWSGSLGMDYVNDTPAPATPASGYNAGSGEHWIDVNLSQQMLYAYAGDTVVNSFLISTGTWLHPTVTGRYHVYVKLRYTDMSGADYYLPNVPYTMYFYQGYGLHGTYWHHNFGTPMSHGCVNLSIPDAEWLYNFASVGTLVNVHY